MADDTRYAVVADHLNTPRRATYPDGDLRWQWGYSAFGDEAPTIADRRFNKTTPLESDFSINLRYPGQYFDVESNLHYNGFRTYNPTVGRYTQGDPLGLYDDLNRFGYVHGNPLRYTDPLGLMGGGSPQGRSRGAPNVNSFGCMGLACITGGTEPTSMSAEFTLGGGIEICDAPLPPPPAQSCQDERGVLKKVDPPGVPIPKRFGGAFIGPGIKRDGRICLRLGAFVSPPIPIPSFDMGPMEP